MPVDIFSMSNLCMPLAKVTLACAADRVHFSLSSSVLLYISDEAVFLPLQMSQYPQFFTVFYGFAIFNMVFNILCWDLLQEEWAWRIMYVTFWCLSHETFSVFDYVSLGAHLISVYFHFYQVLVLWPRGMMNTDPEEWSKWEFVELKGKFSSTMKNLGDLERKCNAWVFCLFVLNRLRWTDWLLCVWKVGESPSEDNLWNSGMAVN